MAMRKRWKNTHKLLHRLKVFYSRDHGVISFDFSFSNQFNMKLHSIQFYFALFLSVVLSNLLWVSAQDAGSASTEGVTSEAGDASIDPTTTSESASNPSDSNPNADQPGAEKAKPFPYARPKPVEGAVTKPQHTRKLEIRKQLDLSNVTTL